MKGILRKRASTSISYFLQLIYERSHYPTGRVVEENFIFIAVGQSINSMRNKCTQIPLLSAQVLIDAINSQVQYDAMFCQVQA